MPGRTAEEILQDYKEENAPGVLRSIDPHGRAAHKQNFLENGAMRHPGHDYSALRDADFTARRAVVEELYQEMRRVTHGRWTQAYVDYLERELLEFDLLIAAQGFHRARAAGDLAKLQAAKAAYTELVSWRYGVPELSVYHGMVNDLRCGRGVQLPTKEHERVYAELLAMLPTPSDPELTAHIKVSPEAKRQVSVFVNALNEGLLCHLPEQEEFTPAEMVACFAFILREAFGEAAEDWRVELGKCAGVSVSPRHKLIKVSPNRASANMAKMRALVVHELGVHLLSAIMGYETDMPLLGWGLPGYGTFQEGLAVVLEESLEGAHKIRGVPLYFAASLAYFGDYDFRDVFEIMWRLSFVTTHPESLEVARSIGYNRTHRVFRGTDELPFLRDTEYYDGYRKAWLELEWAAGSEEALRALLTGKYDPSVPFHRRIASEARTR